MSNHPFLTGLSTAGIGTGVGYIAAAVIQSRSTKKTSADDANAIVGAATELTDRLLKRNEQLAHANAQARNALSKLIQAVQTSQDVFEKFPEVGDGANNRAMMIVLQAALYLANTIEI